MGNARGFVLKLLVRQEQSGSYSNILLDQKLSRSQLDEREKKFAAALFYGVIERRLTLDAIIDSRCNKKAEKLSSDVRNILRMGIYQLKYMDSVPDNAAVDESVKLAKKGRNPAAAGFVNALLRGFIRDNKCLPSVKGKVKMLALEYSCPEWLVRKWADDYGFNACEGILRASLGKAPEYARLNTAKSETRFIISMLEQEGVHVTDMGYGCVKLSGFGAVEELEAFKQGLIHVQDLSCQLCCMALDPKAGDTVLDLCAAPGGKTFTIAELMNNKGQIMAFDLHENRVKLIKSGAERLGLDCVSASVNNAKEHNCDIPLSDKVLCDVPCSGLGVIRRKPEIKYKPENDLERLPEIQFDILKTSATYVRVGGTLVYSTCSLSKAENEAVVERFLSEMPDFEPVIIGELAGKTFDSSSVTIFPDMFDSDGFFIAKFRRLR